jgi:hypothetical protein
LERVNASAEFAGEDFDFMGWNIAEGAAEEFLPEGGMLSGEGGKFLVCGG